MSMYIYEKYIKCGCLQDGIKVTILEKTEKISDLILMYIIQIRITCDVPI